MTDQAKRKWYRIGFSVRDLFWFTLVVALVLALLLEHRKYAEQSEQRMDWEHRAAVARSMLKDVDVDLDWSDKVVHRSQGNGFTKKYILDRKASGAIPTSWTPPPFPVGGS